MRSETYLHPWPQPDTVSDVSVEGSGNGGESQVKDAGVKKVVGAMYAVQTEAKVIRTCANHQGKLKLIDGMSVWRMSPVLIYEF